MKFIVAFAALMGLARANDSVHPHDTPASDYIANANHNLHRSGMWIFGETSGLKIFTPDGALMLKHMSPEMLGCPENRDGTAVECGWGSVASDGTNYVFTDVGNGMVDVFDIKSGELAGSFETCDRSRDFQYVPSLEQVWFRCARYNFDDPDGMSGYWDTFSTRSLSTNFPEVALKLEDPGFNSTDWGRAIFLDDRKIGYSTSWGEPVLRKVDLVTRQPLPSIPLPLISRTWPIKYNPVNKHIYLRTYVCCTCGSPTADVAECRAYGDSVHMDDVLVLTGPSANPNMTQVGGCGGGCAGSVADTIGLYEVDTETDTIVGSILGVTGLGAPEPYVTPSGEYVLMFEPGNLRIIKPGMNGQPSTVMKDLALPNDSAMNSFVMLDSEHIVLASSDDTNEMYVINIMDGTRVTIKLDNNPTSTADNRGRSLFHVPGTPYIWVSAMGGTGYGTEGTMDARAYVVELNMEDMASSMVIREVMDVQPEMWHFVENMDLITDLVAGERLDMEVAAAVDDKGAELLMKIDEDVAALRTSLQAEIKVLEGQLKTLESKTESMSNSDNTVVSSPAATESQSQAAPASTEEQSQTLSIVALVVSIVALLVGGFAAFNANKAMEQAKMSPSSSITIEKDQASLDA